MSTRPAAHAYRLRAWSVLAGTIAIAPLALVVICAASVTTIDGDVRRDEFSKLEVAGRTAQISSDEEIAYAAELISKNLGVPASVSSPKKISPALSNADQLIDGTIKEGRVRLLIFSALIITTISILILGMFLIAEYRLARWLRYFRRIALAHSGGRSSARAIGLSRLPKPLAEMAIQLNNMADSIEVRANDLERANNESTKLLQEIHHRVKNNFAIIASLLRLHKTTLVPAYQSDIRFLEEHIFATATAYRVAYAAKDTSSVPAIQLVEEVLDALRDVARCPADKVVVAAQKDYALVGLDKAIALGLYMAYRLSSFFDQCILQSAPLSVGIQIDGINIVVSFNIVAKNVLLVPTLRIRLAEAYLRQLGGVFVQLPDGSGRLSVPL